MPYIGVDSFRGIFKIFTHDATAVLCNPSDVLMLWDGERAGLCAYGLRGAIGSTITRLRPKQGIDGNFLYHQLSRFFQWIQAQRIGTGVPHVPKDLAVTLRLPIPDNIEEQTRIAEILNTVDEAIEKSEAVIAKLEQVRSGLLHDLLTRGVDEQGQLRDPTVHPEQFQVSRFGLIRKEWTINSLNSIVRHPNDLIIGPFGSNLLASDYRTEGIPVVFVRDIREDGFVWNSKIYVSQDKANELRAHTVLAGDVLITKMGMPPCIATVYPNTMPNGLITADVIRLRPRVDMATSFWLASYFNSMRFAACIRKITGGVTRPKVTLAEFREQPVLLPSLDEQERIKEIAAKIGQVINDEETKSQKLQMLKSGLMSDLLTGRVRVPESIESGVMNREDLDHPRSYR